jgi:hypothetical protein
MFQKHRFNDGHPSLELFNWRFLIYSGTQRKAQRIVVCALINSPALDRSTGPADWFLRNTAVRIRLAIGFLRRPEL